MELACFGRPTSSGWRAGRGLHLYRTVLESVDRDEPVGYPVIRIFIFLHNCADGRVTSKNGVYNCQNAHRTMSSFGVHAAVNTSSVHGRKPPNHFFRKNFLLAHPTQLAESFPMGPCSTFGDKNSLRYDLGPQHYDCHVSTQ